MYFLINYQGAVSAFGNKKEADKAHKDLGEEGKNAVIVSAAAELNSFPAKTLTEVFNASVEEADQVKKFTKKDDKTLGRILHALNMKHDEKYAAKAAKNAEKTAAGGTNGGEPKAAGTPREGSKTALLVARLGEGPSTLEELCTASGFDDRNARTTIGILRSRKGMVIDFDKPNKKYSLGVAAPAVAAA